MTTLARRVKQLETRFTPPEPVARYLTAEDIRIAQGIIERSYADPERYAARIAIFEGVESKADAD